MDQAPNAIGPHCSSAACCACNRGRHRAEEYIVPAAVTVSTGLLILSTPTDKILLVELRHSTLKKMDTTQAVTLIGTQFSQRRMYGFSKCLMGAINSALEKFSRIA